MTALPRELVRKQPANTPVRRDTGRTIEGRLKPTRGWKVRAIFTTVVFLLLTAGMTGFMLSMLHQYS